MGNVDRETIIFDRTSGALEAPNLRSRVLVRAMQAAHKILAPVGHIGISRAHRLISRLLRPDTVTAVREGAFEFRFPSGDYYWNRLLDASWSYEPEIDVILKRFARVPFVFVDLGANFGFWSTRVAAGVYGPHKVIAVEASSYCHDGLKENMKGKDASLHHRAIDDTSGKTIPLFGERHAGFSIDETWLGSSGKQVDEVVSITIDDLLDEEKIDCAQQPVIVKLDVEGVELRALKGASRTIAGNAIFIIEDADRDAPSAAIRYALDELGMCIIHVDRDRFVELSTLEDLQRVKAQQSRIQTTGLNLLATKSPYWRDQMNADRFIEQGSS
ncbi:MAG: FkbM family methyltransferase [Parvibaculaceae bacterium]